ncbi:hypothetical protein PHLGIDRAFT_53692, partial [Phlebiopsis gigantea 11061_1 CR5-6]
GPSPALRILFYRLARLASRPVSLVIVFDGPLRPGLKRGKKVLPTEYFLAQHLRAFAQAFGFFEHTAPGEAEAELAEMNRIGTIDAVLTDDIDVLAFGAHTVIRNPNIKHDRDDVCVYTACAIKEHTDVCLDRDDMVLIAVLSGGGDYSP